MDPGVKRRKRVRGRGGNVLNERSNLVKANKGASEKRHLVWECRYADEDSWLWGRGAEAESLIATPSETTTHCLWY